MELSNSNIKRNSYIFSKESCSYISGNGNPPKKFLIFQEAELSYISRSNFLSSKPTLTLKTHS